MRRDSLRWMKVAVFLSIVSGFEISTVFGPLSNWKMIYYADGAFHLSNNWTNLEQIMIGKSIAFFSRVLFRPKNDQALIKQRQIWWSNINWKVIHPFEENSKRFAFSSSRVSSSEIRLRTGDRRNYFLNDNWFKKSGTQPKK